MEQLPPIPRLSEMINEIINDPIEAKLIAFKFKRLPVSQAVKKMALLDEWNQRIITDWTIGDNYKEVTDGVYVTEAKATAKTPTSSSGNIHYRTTNLCYIALKNKEDTCKAIVNINGEMIYLICGEVKPSFRGQGHMRQLYNLITKFSFEFAGADRIIARADTPRKSLFSNNPDDSENWRTKINPETGETLLLEAWLKQKDCYKITGYDGEEKYNAFAIVSEEVSQNGDTLAYLERNGHIFN